MLCEAVQSNIYVNVISLSSLESLIQFQLYSTMFISFVWIEKAIVDE